jgi:hypothetical protein
MANEQPNRIDVLFDKWIDEAKNGDTVLLLRGLHMLCTRIEENGYSLQQVSEDISGMSSKLGEKLDVIAGRLHK